MLFYVLLSVHQGMLPQSTRCSLPPSSSLLACAATELCVPLFHCQRKGVESSGSQGGGEHIPKRFENPVEIPTAVFDGLEIIQVSGETNMQDYHAVEVIAARLGYPKTAQWIHEHKNTPRVCFAGS